MCSCTGTPWGHQWCDALWRLNKQSRITPRHFSNHVETFIALIGVERESPTYQASSKSFPRHPQRCPDWASGFSQSYVPFNFGHTVAEKARAADVGLRGKMGPTETCRWGGWLEELVSGSWSLRLCLRTCWRSAASNLPKYSSRGGGIPILNWSRSSPSSTGQSPEASRTMSPWPQTGVFPFLPNTRVRNEPVSLSWKGAALECNHLLKVLYIVVCIWQLY